MRMQLQTKASRNEGVLIAKFGFRFRVQRKGYFQKDSNAQR